MKQRLKFFGGYALYWIGYFILARLLFLLYEYNYSFDLSFKEWLLTFTNGIRMDISTAGYILAIIGLILTATSFNSGKLINKIIQPFTIFLLILTSIIIISDLELYKNWGFRMDSTPLLYLANPKEAMASTELWLEIVLFLLTIGYVFLGIYVYKKIIRKKVVEIEKSNLLSPLLLLLLTGSMILPVRGSLGIAPMNTGMVYFSENKFANHAAVNVVWNVMNSLADMNKSDKTYHFMNDEIAESLTNQLNEQRGEGIKLLKEENPNIVVIILESFSSKVITELCGQWKAAPNFDALSKQCILFKHFYANGSRSDKGIVSVISGFPAQPTSSIIKTPSKTESLPSLYKSLESRFYSSYFYYGGNIDFANMRSYFINSGVDHIISIEDFNSKLNNSKWGVHDEYLFDKLYSDIVNHKGPFIKTVFTLSSHDPFDVPMQPIFKGTDRAALYLNSIFYTDSCLGKFFSDIKKTEVWNNTLFILVADHGSPRPGESQNHYLDKFEIPMLWLGGVLNDSIKVVERIGSQIDIPATLLNQIGINYTDFSYSKDLFAPENKDFAFYVYNDGFAFITDSSKVIFDNDANKIIYSEGVFEQDIDNGKAYLQTLMKDFNSR